MGFPPHDRDWFATRNFHGHWYTDSDRLNDLVPFRRDTFEQALARAVATLPASVRSAGRVPGWIVKNLVMRPLTRKPRGTMHAIAHHDVAAIRAHFGSLDEWRAIGDWTTFTVPDPSRTPTYLDHGFDEDKTPEDWDRSDYVSAAVFRGGELVSPVVPDGRPREPLIWSCAFGHIFAASPFLILTGGHWCPDCTRDSAGYERQAERNPFLAQLYSPPVASLRRSSSVWS